MGVSTDDVESHAKWKQELQIPHLLLADTQHEVAERYGVWVQKTMMGKTHWGVARTTFVIDERGTVAKVFSAVKVQGHSKEVLEALKQMTETGKRGNGETRQ
jgi:peroxiredoxin Q/BCP